MEICVFNPRTKRESLQDFNGRVQQFCADHAVVGIAAQVLHSALILTLTLAEDLDQAEVPTLTATVRPISAEDKELEEALAGMVEAEHRRSTEDAPNVPASTLIAARTDKPGDGWIVILSINGVAQDDEDGSEDGDDGDDDDDDPPLFEPGVKLAERT